VSTHARFLFSPKVRRATRLFGSDSSWRGESGIGATGFGARRVLAPRRLEFKHGWESLVRDDSQAGEQEIFHPVENRFAIASSICS